MHTTRKRIAGTAVLLALVLGVGPWSAAGADTAATRVTLGTSTKGGGFELFGQHLADVINAVDSSLRVEAIATKGSKQNLAYLEEARVDIGLVEGNAARHALAGNGAEPTELQVLSVMYPNPGMFVVRADSPYRRIGDLKGKAVAFGTRASGLRILATDVLDGLDLKPDRDFQQVILDHAGDGPRLVLEKRVEALWGAGIGWPGFVKVAESPEGARFIAPTAAEIERIQAKHPHLKTMSVPAGTYRGQNARIDSVGLWSLILVRPELPDEMVYRLARAIHRGEGTLAARLDQGSYATARNTVEQVPFAQLHPGAARYFREVGLLP